MNSQKTAVKADVGCIFYLKHCPCRPSSKCHNYTLPKSGSILCKTIKLLGLTGSLLADPVGLICSWVVSSLDWSWPETHFFCCLNDRYSYINTDQITWASDTGNSRFSADRCVVLHQTPLVTVALEIWILADFTEIIEDGKAAELPTVTVSRALDWTSSWLTSIDLSSTKIRQV